MQKWSSTRKNFEQEHIAISKDDNCRQNKWRLSKVIKNFPDKKGFVRTVKLLTGSIDRNGSRDNRKVARPVDKVVLIAESGKVE